MSKLPQILLDFASAPSLQDWEVEGDTDCLTLEDDTTLNTLVLVKKVRGFDPAVTYPQLDWRFPYYELVVRLHSRSFIYINVLDETGKNRTLLYSSAILPGLNKWEEFHVPLGKDVSDGNWYSLMIDIPKHMEQAQWPGFVKVNWLRLRGEVVLAGIRGCDDEDSLRESAIASPYSVVVPSSRDPAKFVPYVISNNRIDLVDADDLLEVARSPQHGHELMLWLSVEDPDKASAIIEEIGPDLLVSLSDSPQDVRVLFSALRDQSPSVGKLLASMITPQFETQMAKSPEDWGKTQLILQRLRALEKVYDFFDHFVEADRSDYGKKKHCQIKFDKALVSGGVAKRGILQHPPLPEEGPSRLPYPPIPIPDHIQELRLDFFIGILDKWPDTGKQQPKFSKDPCKEDAVKFNVRINGKVELDEKLNSVGWVPYSLPIELPTGGELTVEFITDAVSSATANWAAWGEPRLVGTRAVQKEVVATASSIPQVSEKPTASESRRFLDEDFPRLENALHDVWISFSGHSPLVEWSATSNWNTLTSRFTDIPEEIRAIFDKVVETRELARGGPSKVTGEQLSSAREGINQILKFLRQRFPTAGVDLPSPVTQATTSQAISERAPSEHQADFAIITALEKEAKAVVSRLENPSIQRFEDRDIRTYHCGTVPIQGTEHSYHVVAVLLPSMGEISAANAVTDTITRWNPRFVLMVGIAGGIPQDDLDLGDVVVADQVVGYEYGKVTDHESKPYEIKPRDHVYPASALLLDRVRNFWDESWTQQVNVPRPDNATRAVSKLFIGPIASGNKVIASTEFRQQLTTRWPKLIAVEMEAEGVFAAVFDRPQIRGTLVIRGICDMADERKADDWQEYAADAAAAFAVSFLRSGPVDPQVRPEEIPPAPAPKEFVPPGPEKISLAKLPSTSPDLFGREKELTTLDAAWEDPQTHIVSLVAWGGVGKTALMNKWLLQTGKDHYRGAERVYGWSFYSQGAREGGQASADQFIAAALEWFGDPDPTKGSPWDKGERLAELVKKQRTLLILDGLEPLQYPPGEMEGRLKDPGLQCLLGNLAHHNPGLCIITTHLPVDDIKHCLGTTVQQIPLEHLTPEAGATLLENLGVKGTSEELEQTAKEFGGHALALTLLGGLLRDAYDGDVRCRGEVGPLEDETQQGAHARRVMESYEKWLGESPELAVLRLMGLFDRPAEGGAIAALRAEPVIPRLTDELKDLTDRKWRLTLAKLRRARLLAEKDPANPDTLDTHPLVREHFGEKLKKSNPEAYQEAHSRLYEYYQSQAPEYPDTIGEMAPLYAAVAHGCQAGRYQDVLEVHRQRIARGNEFYSTRMLGTVSENLAACSYFFDPPWSQLVDGLIEKDKGYVLDWAGFDLRALGRLGDAIKLMEDSLNVAVANEDWLEASDRAGNLSEFLLFRGDIVKALEYAEQSVKCADNKVNSFTRIRSRTIQADVLHQSGQLEKADRLFRQAERIQAELDSRHPLLYAFQGFLYCDLFLSRGEYREAQRRAIETMNWTRESSWSLLAIALSHYLTLGVAHLLSASEEGADDFGKAADYLNQAVDGLRNAGQQHHLPRGLLARTNLYRLQKDFDKAKRDLEKALSIATRGGMRLYEADCHLEYARLHLACGEEERARQSLAQAKEMIEEMGYHRLDSEVAELEKMLQT